jgi:hypothetical protein
MALTPQQGPDRKRVKVYELKNNDWYDRGTGFCSGTLANVSICFFSDVGRVDGEGARVAQCGNAVDQAEY